MNADKHRLNSISEKIIGYAFNVSNTLGAGFLEKVYQNALHLELLDAGFQVEKEKSITISYKGKVIGEYFADLLVNQQVIIEIKAVQSLNEIHQAQLLNYLKATGLHLGLLINFGTPKVQIKRMVNGKGTTDER
jgi:GxxExxY protein